MIVSFGIIDIVNEIYSCGIGTSLDLALTRKEGQKLTNRFGF